MNRSSNLSTPTPKWPSIFLLVLICWCLLSGIYHSAITGLAGADFRQYYETAERLNKGLPPYDGKMNYVYTPFLAVLIRPLAHFPLGQAFKIWTLMNGLFMFVGMALYALAARFKWKDVIPIGIMIFVGFRFLPSVYDFGTGNINIVLLMLVSGMFLADSHGKMEIFGVLIALGAIIKIWVLGLVIYLLLKRAWRAIALSIGIYCFLFVFTFNIVGWSKMQEFLQVTLKVVNNNRWISQSIYGFARIHFAPNMHTEPILNSAIVYWAFIATGFLIILSGLVYLFRSEPARTPYESRLRLGFFILSLLLLLPICWMS